MLTLYAASTPPEPVNVLLISSLPEDRISLRHIFDRSNWRLEQVSTCRDALAYTGENRTAVVICERELPDGDWKVVLDELEGFRVRPNLIVTSRLADDRLWAEVLNLGGYDVLAQPFDADEVYRVVSLAWDEWRRRAIGNLETRLPCAQVS